MPNNDDDSEWVTQTIVMEGSNIALMLFLNDVAALVVVVLPVRINDIAKVLGIVVTDADAAAARRDRQVIVVRDPMPESCIGSLLGW